jgi:hypothetical protein
MQINFLLLAALRRFAKRTGKKDPIRILYR